MRSEALQEGMERQTICFPRYGTQDVLQRGDPGFKDGIARLYPAAENNALEALITLKTHLNTLSTDDFWTEITDGISNILGADMSFVFKRVLVDDQDSAVEMPPYGEPGSCLMAAAFHYCSNDGSKNTIRKTKFSAYGCPCAYMRHDRVFLIPEDLNDFITNNPNKLPTPAEAYIAAPLFADGKCFAHFGAMWSTEAAAQRKLSWAFIEMVLHSLEDMILQRFLQGSNFTWSALVPEKRAVIPHDAVTVAQSLRPYAGSLSHELRTPMQGIVGMLDVMYATVQEAVETQTDPKLRKLFEDLKENIEVVQDSSRRAVEAADNVVHAYDMDMSVPELPAHLFDDPDSASPFSAAPVDRRPEIFVAGSNLPLSRKRRREEAWSRQSSNASNSKFQRVEGAQSSWARAVEPSDELKEGFEQAEEVKAHEVGGATPADAEAAEDPELAASSVAAAKRMIVPGVRHTNMREVFQYVINEGLKLGGRPDSTIAQETEHGETIEVRSRGSDGSIKTKTIDWSVHPNMPTTLFTDEKDLSKLISCVFLNAIKFTAQNGGKVCVYARMSSRGRYISIRISDNGPGIPAGFLPRLFKPFSRENESITRQSEGLGLGLLVAKGIARKLGGDLVCTRAETEGSDHGSEFEIKVPVRAGEQISRPSSPFGSPMPRRATPAPIVIPKTPPPTAHSFDSPTKLSHALHAVVNGARPDGNNTLASPTSPKTFPRITIPETNVTVTSSPPTPPTGIFGALARPRIRKSVSNPEIDRDLANKFPLTFLVAEDNKINRKLLVSMLSKFGYKAIHEAHDGAEAVRQMKTARDGDEKIDVVLMDLWMPRMDGYEATQHILSGENGACNDRKPTVLAVTADVTDGAQERAARVGMKGFMTKPYKIHDLQRLITEYCAQRQAEMETMVIDG
ncbi:hypothetical protein LTR37_010397 [Vermiconidia calcicola]|uniref:Uncharacterized protein n=1 Tax=Vermiconidia calcicola TaxID=1690605 RepID=A0ACC3N573_9PEZI|nr:hypothetical protein LTR37_010397 [Vermiconidia calcicola]